MYVPDGQDLELLPPRARGCTSRGSSSRARPADSRAPAGRAPRGGCCRSRTSAAHCRAGFALALEPQQQLVEARPRSSAESATQMPATASIRAEPDAPGAARPLERQADPPARAADEEERRRDRRSRPRESPRPRRAARSPAVLPRDARSPAGTDAATRERGRAADARATARWLLLRIRLADGGGRRSSGRSRRRRRSASGRTAAPGRARRTSSEFGIVPSR